MAEEVKVKQGKSTKVKETLRVIKYALCAGSAGIIETLSFTLLNETMNWPYWPAYLIALVLSVLWNFTLNRKYTFRSAANIPVAMAKVFGFYLVFTPLSTWLGNLAEGHGIHDFLILAVTMICNFVLEFLFCKLVVYRGKENTASPAHNQ